MKAWIYQEDLPSPPHISLERVKLPEAQADDVLLKIERVSVCATDEMLFAGLLKRALNGVIPGHELCGRIMASGAHDSRLKEGQLVAVESHYSLLGGVDEGVIGLWPPHTSAGEPLRLYNGGFAEYVAVPATCVHPLPENCLDHGFWPSLFEPAGNDFLLARIAMQQEGASHFAVAGCGPHGLYAQIFLRHFGANRIVAFELDPERRTFARELGICDAVLDPASEGFLEEVLELTEGALFDVAIDMVGKSGQAFDMCCDLTRPEGHVLLFGLFSGSYEIDGVGANDLIFGRRHFEHSHKDKTLRLIGVTGREGIWSELIKTVCSNRELQVQLMKPVTVVGSLDDLDEHARSKPPGILKAALYPFSS